MPIVADFFSFGTNDLTQTTFGISRDDGGKFIPEYLKSNGKRWRLRAKAVII